METKIYSSELEDFILDFREYSIDNDENYKAAQVDFQFSKNCIDELIELKTEVLNGINEPKIYQITEFAYDFLLQSLIKKNITLFGNIVEYAAKIA